MRRNGTRPRIAVTAFPTLWMTYRSRCVSRLVSVPPFNGRTSMGDWKESLVKLAWVYVIFTIVAFVIALAFVIAFIS